MYLFVIQRHTCTKGYTMTNPKFNNQRYLGTWVKIVGEPDVSAICVKDITGAYYYGFTEFDGPRIIDVCKDEIEEVLFDGCDRCYQKTPIHKLNKVYNDLSDEPDSLCVDCL